MTVAIYLKVEGVKGEAKPKEGWIDVLSFNWAAAQPGNMMVGGGGGAGKVMFDDLSVQACIDRASPTLLGFCASGKHISKVILSVNKAGGEKIEYARIELEDVIITRVNFSGVGKTENILVNYVFQAAKVSQHYWEQTNTGGKSAEIVSGWDIKKNQAL
ncbi:Hcp family type VI secretion system effector [Pantoea stewartii]|uniref:Hcp family type VI secretion system effector n=1 Tax=Pantoea stewartii TaxID=66269 RepID=UPI00162A836E|nr:type VI secretion system tube protein Hcp [Pantoea stewartii]MBC0856441.1 type VI secretion system tube protein Hcp [Pantoea stewartii]